MPKRVIDFDAMWGSDKLASCAEWAQAEYAWLYGLADASGCFELTNLRVIWGRVAAIRRNLTIERLEQIFGEFQDKGLLFVWEHEGKRYGHWTGSDVPGRLPPPSWRMRLERLAPPVPKQLFAEYVSRFARGRAALPGGAFRVEAGGENPRNGFESSDLKSQSAAAGSGRGRGVAEQPASFSQPFLAGLKPQSESNRPEPRAGGGLHSLNDGLEEGQAEDLNWNRNLEGNEKRCAPQRAVAPGEIPAQREDLQKPLLGKTNSNSQDLQAGSDIDFSRPEPNRTARGAAAGEGGWYRYRARDKELLLAKELNVGRGPTLGPGMVKPEAIERCRARDALRNGSRSP